MIILLLLFHLFLLINLRFTAWPEMVSFPYLLNHGFVLYKDFVHVYPPLLTNVLALVYQIFGTSLLTLKLFTWGYILICDVLVWKILKKNYLVFLCYILLQVVLDGNQLWFDMFLTLPLLLILYLENGLFLTFGLLIKQTFLGFFIPVAIYFHKNLKVALGGLIIGGTMFLTWLIVNNALSDFWNWNFVYPFTYWRNFPGYIDFNLNKSEIMVLIFFFITLIPTLITWKNKLMGFLLMSLLITYPRFSFFHLQPFLVVLVLVWAQQTNKLYKLALIIGSITIFIKLGFPQWNKSVRFWDKESIKLAKIISINSKSNDKIFLIGLNSLLYSLAQRLPPKPWVDNYGWYYAAPGIEDKVIQGLKNGHPLIFIKTPDVGNWYDLGTYRPPKVMKFINDNYYLRTYIREDVQLWARK